MVASIVVIINVTRHAFSQVYHVVFRVQIDVLAFYRPPETLNPNIIKTARFAIHTDLDSVSFTDLVPLFARIVTTLIRVYYLGSTVSSHRCIENLYRILSIKGIIKSPAYYVPTINIYNGI